MKRWRKLRREPLNSSHQDVGEILEKKLCANIVMLGVLIKVAGIVNGESMENTVRNTFPERFVAVNIEAYEEEKERVGREKSITSSCGFFVFRQTVKI